MATRKHSRTGKPSKQIMQRATEVKRRFTLVCWLAVIVLVTIVIGKHFAQEQFGSSALPDNAIEQLQKIVVNDSIANTVLKYKAHIVYFNPQNHEPNATIYELTAAETEGNEPRANNFIHDENVPQCAHAWDYSNSGYDRGHMTPAADMKWDAEAMQQSFLMTNICPQDHSLNAGAWSRLEKKLRAWAQRDSSLIIATGPIIGQSPQTIGKEVQIPVPEAFFKVVYAPRQARAIAFIYPNSPNCNSKMRKYAVSVRQVEHLTGLNFFSSLPDEEENRIEQQNDFAQWEQNIN
ncbi:MAG: DNA/RNA non-specific endonuclease [Muribaculaceae bacterium]